MTQLYNFFSQKKKKRHTYFDIGANEGQSIIRLNKINQNSLIHSFEPTPELFNKIKKKNLEEKGVVLNNFAIGDKSGNLSFYTYEYHHINSFNKVDRKTKFSKSRILRNRTKDENFEKKIEVEVKTLDDYCFENQITEIDFIKIDTQGYEEEVLIGMKEMLKTSSISIIELEIILGFAYEKSFSFNKCENILEKYEYKLIAIESAGNIISHSDYQTNVLYVNKKIYSQIRDLHERNIDIPGVTKKTDKLNPYSY